VRLSRLKLNPLMYFPAYSLDYCLKENLIPSEAGMFALDITLNGCLIMLKKLRLKVRYRRWYLVTSLKPLLLV